MVVADLHIHTTNSDGQLTLSKLPGVAREHDLDAVAVTDHDRVHPDIDQPVSVKDGVTIIHGIELRVTTGDLKIDLLGYGVSKTDQLVSLVESLQTNRIERAKQIVDQVEAETGVTLDVEFEAGVGRPHIARAIADSDADYDYKGAFEELIGDGCPCYVARDIPSFAEGRACLEDACAVVGLAHPFRYDDPEQAIELAAELDAIERYYPYGRSVDESLLDDAISEYDLLCTGGSDAHEETLGEAGISASEFEALREHLPR